MICILFLLILRNLQVISQNLQNFLTLLNPILNFWSSTITKYMVNKIGCIITIRHSERIHANGYLESSIGTKLTQMQQFYPWFFLPTNIVPQVSFQPLIHHLYLAINLGIISCVSCQICPHQFEESCQNALKNLLSLSLTMLLGSPCNLKNYLKNNSASCAAMKVVVTTNKWENWLSLSTTTNMQSLPNTLENQWWSPWKCSPIIVLE